MCDGARPSADVKRPQSRLQFRPRGRCRTSRRARTWRSPIPRRSLRPSYSGSWCTYRFECNFFRPEAVLSQHMPQPVTITFRDQTTGRINDLLIDEGQPSAQSQNLLGYLAGVLVNYKKEGIELTPSVVLCDNIQEVLRTFPSALSHRVGTAQLDPSSGPMVLKNCAPLSGRNWFIFIERAANNTMNYGIFTYFAFRQLYLFMKPLRLIQINFAYSFERQALTRSRSGAQRAAS